MPRESVCNKGLQNDRILQVLYNMKATGTGGFLSNPELQDVFIHARGAILHLFALRSVHLGIIAHDRIRRELGFLNAGLVERVDVQKRARIRSHQLEEVQQLTDRIRADLGQRRSPGTYAPPCTARIPCPGAPPRSADCGSCRPGNAIVGMSSQPCGMVRRRAEDHPPSGR